MGLAEDAIDMVENDVGGGFGARGEFYPEDFLIPFAARHCGRPVKWTEDRREHLMTINHAREAECDVEIACKRDGTILGLRGHAYVDMGAYMRTNGAVGARNVAQFMSGPIASRTSISTCRCLLTNKTPVGTYRGPGRFETDFFRERLFDMVARDLGIDRVEFRRRNLVARKRRCRTRSRPSRRSRARTSSTAAITRVTLDRCLEEIGWAEKAKLQGQADRRPLSRPRHRLLHRGRRRRPEGERAARARSRTARSRSIVGSSAVGQGVETVFAQIAADALEMPMDRIRSVFHGSTAYVSDGYGAYHSRSIVMGGSAILDAAQQAARRRCARKRRGGSIAAPRGRDRRRTRPAVPTASRLRWAELAPEPSRSRAPSSTTSTPTAYGAHAAHVAVDPKTGHVEIIDYVVVEDCGRIINPLTLRGQVDRLAGAGPRRRAAGAPGLRRGGPASDRLARRLPGADRERLSERPRR